MFKRLLRLVPQRSAVRSFAALAVALALVGIISTYSIFNQTSDEPAHIATGMEWLQYGTYRYEPLHPPLARVAVALGPYLIGARLHGETDFSTAGNGLLYSRGRYLRNLSAARLGILPFFLLAVWVVWRWSRRLFGYRAALLAVLLFSSLPPVLAHAGLATTDLPVAATIAAALLAFVIWLEKPTAGRGILLGLATALALLSKFSAFGFLPACWLGILALKSVVARSQTDRRATLAGLKRIWVPALACFVLVWAGYRFSFGPLSIDPKLANHIAGRFSSPGGELHQDLVAALTVLGVPAPALGRGLLDLYYKEAAGDSIFVLGRLRWPPPWFFFPVALGLKTPLPLLALAALGLVILGLEAKRNRRWQPLAPGLAACAILLVAMGSRVALGVRHILAIYPLLAIVAGSGAYALWQQRKGGRAGRIVQQLLVVVLLAWQLVGTVVAWPDFLPYFNLVAGSNPGRYLVDSDLDWGQDLTRLCKTLHSWGVQNAWLAYFGTADPSRCYSPRFSPLPPYQQVTGWIAASEFKIREEGAWKAAGAYAWLNRYRPVPWAGRSIRLYFIPGPAPEPASRSLQSLR